MAQMQARRADFRTARGGRDYRQKISEPSVSVCACLRKKFKLQTGRPGLYYPPVLFPPRSQSDLPKRVVVTGGGILTALGATWAENSEGFRTGRAAFRPVTLFDASRHRAKWAAEVDLPDLSFTRLNPRRMQRLDRACKQLLWAAQQAWNQADWMSPQAIPVVLGTTSGGMRSGEVFYRQTVSTPGMCRHQPARVQQYQCQAQALELAEALGIHGPLTLIANACASGANAIGHAWHLIRSGHAERVLTGGYDALSEMVFSGFDSLQALSTTQCRPFDAARDGLSLGEGAAVLALEELHAAKRRGAAILGEIIGYGAATDGHHLTQPHPCGDAALASMRKAAAIGNISPEQIGYLNAHGTGTPLNDSSEAAAINRWAGDHAPALPVSSTKSSVGHLLGAAGAVEAAVCLMALQGQWLPPSPVLRTPDPCCSFPIVREPAQASFEFAMSNSFGFGGANATLIFRRCA
jgi:3-oxoacyl-[acyl-carrier-protein] synthase II